MSKKIQDMTYEEMEKECEKVLEKLSKDISLDEAKKCYDYGKELASEMEKRLGELQKEVKDEVEE